MYISILLFGFTTFAQQPTLLDVARTSQAIRVNGTIVHSASRTKHFDNAAVYRAHTARRANGLECRAGISEAMSATKARSVLSGLDGTSFDRVQWTALDYGSALPPWHWTADLTITPGVEFLAPTAQESRHEFRKCAEGHWDNWYDPITGEPHRNYICDRYNEHVEWYDVTVQVAGKTRAGVGYAIACTMRALRPEETVMMSDFNTLFDNKFSF